MAWIWLTLAGLLEVVWAVGLKYTDGFTRLAPSVLTLAAMAASVYFLALAGAPSRSAPATRSGPASARSASLSSA
jgi:quaternary ammonium compound-resistance protein SugE